MGISWIEVIRAVSLHQHEVPRCFSAVVAMVYAEADPYLLGYGGYGLGYAGLGHRGYAGIGLKSAPCVNAANVPVPCAAGLGLHYGKREAEAEPFYGYGYAGLGYAGLGYGYGIHSSHVGLCTNYLGAAVPC